MFEQDSDILTIAEDEEIETAIEQPNQQYETEQSSQPETVFDVQDQQLPQEKPSPTQQKETDAFVNTSYSTNNLRKVYKKYDIVQTYVPAKKQTAKKKKEFETFVTEQHNYVPERESVVVEKLEQKPVYKLSQKAKTWLFATVAIFVMLGGLAIYNAIHISTLDRQIAQTQYDITEVNKSLEKTAKTLGKLTDEDAVLDTAENQYDMHLATNENTTTIELNQKNQIEDYQGESNFFDKICEFIRHLFGG